MSVEQDLKKINELETKLLKDIDEEIMLDEEINEIAAYTAKQLNNKPFVPMSIQERDFILIAAMHTNTLNKPCIQLVAREKTKVITPNSKLIKADLEIDTRYTKEENLKGGITALLGHITGRIKPEALDQ